MCDQFKSSPATPSPFVASNPKPFISICQSLVSAIASLAESDLSYTCSLENLDDYKSFALSAKSSLDTLLSQVEASRSKFSSSESSIDPYKKWLRPYLTDDDEFEDCSSFMKSKDITKLDIEDSELRVAIMSSLNSKDALKLKKYMRKIGLGHLTIE
jgi:hypothetical protein